MSSRKNSWAKKQQQQESVAPGAVYTCPMHPEVRQQGPGDCPICGMALEPEQVSLDDGPSEELGDMTRRFWIGLVLTLPVLVLEMGGHLIGLGYVVRPQNLQLDSAGAGNPRGSLGAAGRSLSGAGNPFSVET